jgi:hypothetical protein
MLPMDVQNEANERGNESQREPRTAGKSEVDERGNRELGLAGRRDCGETEQAVAEENRDGVSRRAIGAGKSEAVRKENAKGQCGSEGIGRKWEQRGRGTHFSPK